MATQISSRTKQVTISHERPTVLIGERINPTGKKRLAVALANGDLEIVRAEALAQVRAGADVLDVNVGVPGVDEEALLPAAVKAVMEVVDVPLCLDSTNARALAAALAVYTGKALINSVNGEERSLAVILPLVKQHGAAVIALTMDEAGIPETVERRVAIAHRIVERAATLGIAADDVVVDCLATTVGANAAAGAITTEAARRVKAELGVNLTLGASNFSFGMPDRELLNAAFLSIAIAAGVTCPVVDVAKVRQVVLATDVVLGRDRFAQRYTKAYRQRQQGLA